MIDLTHPTRMGAPPLHSLHLRNMRQIRCESLGAVVRVERLFCHRANHVNSPTTPSPQLAQQCLRSTGHVGKICGVLDTIALAATPAAQPAVLHLHTVLTPSPCTRSSTSYAANSLCAAGPILLCYAPNLFRRNCLFVGFSSHRLNHIINHTYR